MENFVDALFPTHSERPWAWTMDNIPLFSKEQELWHMPACSCLSKGVYHSWWNGEAVSADKCKGNPTTPSAYRSLRTLDTSGKLCEKVLKYRLKRYTEKGLRKGGSPTNSMDIAEEILTGVIETIIAAQRVNHYSRSLVMVVALKVKNGLNVTRWDVILMP